MIYGCNIDGPIGAADIVVLVVLAIVLIALDARASSRRTR